jgi:hypothetical protein
VEVDDDEDDEYYDFGGEDDVYGPDPSERAEADRLLKEPERRERRRNKFMY